MKTILTLLFCLAGLLAFAQTDSTKKPITADVGFNIKTAEFTIDLKPVQKKVLMELDSSQKAFAKDVEANKAAIDTFNRLMAQSKALSIQAENAYGLILEAAGFDPKKNQIINQDLDKGKLTVGDRLKVAK